MNEIMQMLILIILGLLGITRFQAHKTKDMKKDIQQAQVTVKKREQELEKIDEVQQKITTITQKKPPEKIEPPESGDTAGRLDRLNRLHERANRTGE
jgi:predicted negative regulator of RcsB-dependent stress response